jgi:hypothetical protein
MTGALAPVPSNLNPWQAQVMCRNIRTLYNYAPPATPDEVQAAALQYIRKVGGTSKPSAANSAAFERAVAAVAVATQGLLDAMVTTAPPRNREVEAAKARERSALRFG